MIRTRFLLTPLFLIFLLAILHTAAVAGRPKLQISENSWDWGRAPQNSVLSHTFWLKNVGTDTLKELMVTVP